MDVNYKCIKKTVNTEYKKSADFYNDNDGDINNDK